MSAPFSRVHARSCPWPNREECLEAFREGDGAGVKVAVLDSGLDAGHADFSALPLAGIWRASMDERGRPVIAPCEGGDALGHGTEITGIIHRVAPRAEIVAIAVLGSDSRQKRHELIAAAARFAIRQGAVVLNCSFGVPSTGVTLPMYKEWTDQAFHHDRIVVAASSNECPAEAEYPAFFAQVIGVTAGAGEDCVPVASTPRHHVTIAAPGEKILTSRSGGGHKQVTGSSFAAAHVSGMLARLLSRHPGLTPSLAREALEHHAWDGDGGVSVG